MELRPGYKQTEVGIIPNDWSLKPFAELFAFRNGVNADKSAYGQGVRFINVLEPINHSHIHGPEITGRVTLPESVATFYTVVQGDVLFNRTSETQEEVGLAATYVGSESIVFGGFVIRGRPAEGAFDPVYSGYALRAPWIRSQIIPMGQGAIRANISQSNLSLVVAPLPRLHEQRAIAAALSDADALLDALTRLIAKKRDVKRAAMQQLLTGHTRLPGFDREWQTKRIDEMGHVMAGKALAAQAPGILRSYLRTKNVLDGRIATDDILEMPMTDVEFERFRILEGDVLLNEGQSLELVGRCSMYRGEITRECAMQNQLLRFRTRQGISPEFAEQLFRWYQHTGVFASIATQTTSVAHLGATRFSVLRVRCPQDLPEQTAIAAVLSDMDAELAALEARRDKTRALKHAMMQDLLTGRTRLVLHAVRESPKDAKRTDGRQANIHFKRSVLAAEIIDRLHDEPTFGHVKFEKMIFLVEQLCDVDTGSTYHRDAAGPYDGRAMRSIDSQLRKQKWFDAQKIEGRYRYEPLANRGKHREYFERYFGGIGAAFDTVIETFRTFTTERCEIVATLFAAWSDLLRKKGPISDDAIVNEVLNNWHESKKRIREERWHKALSWMRDHGFVPHDATGAV